MLYAGTATHYVFVAESVHDADRGRWGLVTQASRATKYRTLQAAVAAALECEDVLIGRWDEATKTFTPGV